MADPLFGTVAPIWSAVPFPSPALASAVAGIPTSFPFQESPTHSVVGSYRQEPRRASV